MSRLEAAWYSNKHWVWLLLPLTFLFWLVSNLRRGLFKLGVKKQIKANVPLIVVGNITVGGTGKTPFVIYLVKLLQGLGYTPAIVSRGYGANTKIGPSFPRLVNAISDPSLTGDEPNLLALRTGVPVVIDSDRTKAVKYASQISGVNIVISDDGLQHYKMARDIEVVLVDGARYFGNGYLLPMGPLREPISRLESVDFTVVNSGFLSQSKRNSKSSLQSVQNKFIDYQLGATSLIKLKGQTVSLLKEETRNVHLISGIGNPERFKTTAQKSGLKVVSEHWFPDHHNFTEADFKSIKLQDNDIIVMTEKDAVKCMKFAQANWYALPVDAVISDSLERNLTDQIKKLKITE